MSGSRSLLSYLVFLNNWRYRELRSCCGIPVRSPTLRVFRRSLSGIYRRILPDRVALRTGGSNRFPCRDEVGTKKRIVEWMFRGSKLPVLLRNRVWGSEHRGHWVFGIGFSKFPLAFFPRRIYPLNSVSKEGSLVSFRELRVGSLR